MNRREFLSSQFVVEFLDWLDVSLSSLQINLKVKSSRFCQGGVNRTHFGISSVLESYCWNSLFSLGGVNFSSSNWSETNKNLEMISDTLKEAVSSGKSDKVYEVCCSILDWGGDRNPNQGAKPILTKLDRQGLLTEYLNTSSNVFHLVTTDLSELSRIQYAGSMWTKIYSLNAHDGLPIYDSRVAVAIAALVELFRQQNEYVWTEVPPSLEFFYVDPNRTVNKLDSSAVAPKGLLNRKTGRYVNKNFVYQWSSCKIRLGWIIEETLSRQPELFRESGSLARRAHAFEAALFMIGYDVQCLSANLRLSRAK